MQRLVAESEFNRCQVRQDWLAITGRFRKFVGGVQSFASVTSRAASLVAGLTALRRGKSQNARAKLSGWQAIFKGAVLVSTLWFTFCGKAYNRKTNEPGSPA